MKAPGALPAGHTIRGMSAAIGEGAMASRLGLVVNSFQPRSRLSIYDFLVFLLKFRDSRGFD